MVRRLTSWFQSDECLGFYKALRFVEAFECCVERDGETKGRIVGYIQKDGGKVKQFFSRRAIINGGPMLAEDITGNEIATLLNNCRKKLKGRAIYVETRNFNDFSNYKDIFEKSGWDYCPHYNFIVTADSIDKVILSFSQNHRRSIKSALKNGVIIENNPTKSEIEGFYDVLNNLYRTKVRTPLFPLSFFITLAEYGKVIVVKSLEGKVIGGIAMATGLLDTCYEWFVCGNDEEYKKYHPSTVATYAGIKYTIENGYRFFDFMGAGAPGDGGYGVRDFKAKFGGELVEYGRFKCILNRPLYAIGCLGVKILKRH